MSFKIDMSSPDVDRQIDLLKHYPEVMERHFKQILKADIDELYQNIKPTIPKHRGRAAAAFKKSLTGKGINLTGRVGWWGTKQPFYINIVEYGAPPHEIGFVPFLGVSWQGKNSRAKQHPGTPKVGFMAAGYSAMRPKIENDMRLASEAVVKEMAIP